MLRVRIGVFRWCGVGWEVTQLAKRFPKLPPRLGGPPEPRDECSPYHPGSDGQGTMKCYIKNRHVLLSQIVTMCKEMNHASDPAYHIDRRDDVKADSPIQTSQIIREQHEPRCRQVLWFRNSIIETRDREQESERRQYDRIFWEEAVYSGSDCRPKP